MVSRGDFSVVGSGEPKAVGIARREVKRGDRRSSISCLTGLGFHGKSRSKPLGTTRSEYFPTRPQLVRAFGLLSLSIPLARLSAKSRWPGYPFKVGHRSLLRFLGLP